MPLLEWPGCLELFSTGSQFMTILEVQQPEGSWFGVSLNVVKEVRLFEPCRGNQARRTLAHIDSRIPTGGMAMKAGRHDDALAFAVVSDPLRKSFCHRQTAPTEAVPPRLNQCAREPRFHSRDHG